MLAIVTSKVKWAFRLTYSRILAHAKQKLGIPSRVSGMQASLCLLRMPFEVTELVCVKLEEERAQKMMYERNLRLRETKWFALRRAAGLCGSEAPTQLCLVLEPMLSAQITRLVLGTSVRCARYWTTSRNDTQLATCHGPCMWKDGERCDQQLHWLHLTGSSGECAPHKGVDIGHLCWSSQASPLPLPPSLQSPFLAACLHFLLELYKPFMSFKKQLLRQINKKCLQTNGGNEQGIKGPGSNSCSS